MKLQPYQRYKPSGVEWLGDIAQDWSVSLIKHLVSTPVTDGPHETPEIVDEGIPFVSAEAISGERINFGKIRGHITADDHKRFSRKYKPRRGDIYLVKSGATTGRVAMVETDIEFNIWSPLAAIRYEPRKVDKQFLFFYVQSKEFQTAVELSWSFGTQQNIGMGVIQNLAVPLPSLAEQRAIAAFLDRETGRVDRLVAKKRELIERLKEKRTAIISRTVTRGLPAEAAIKIGLPVNPPLKPSGLDWLGDIPKHWELAELRRVTLFITSGSRGWAEHYSDEGALFVRIGNLTRHSINVDLSDVQHVDPPPGAEGERTRIRQGDILFSITAYLGSVAVATEPVLGAYINQHVALVRVAQKRVDPRFVAYSVLGDVGQLQLSGLGYGGTKIQLSLDDVKSLRFCIPSLLEQVAIAAYLDQETAKLDSLVAKVEMAIERLQEYRTALITAAVTGKIDVRKQVNQ